jgi:hypothetical protein
MLPDGRYIMSTLAATGMGAGALCAIPVGYPFDFIDKLVIRHPQAYLVALSGVESMIPTVLS